jgi:hypothetical protein
MNGGKDVFTVYIASASDLVKHGMYESAAVMLQFAVHDLAGTLHTDSRGVRLYALLADALNLSNNSGAAINALDMAINFVIKSFLLCFFAQK